MAANVGILLCWTLLAPIRYVRTFDDGTDIWNRHVSSTGRCRSKSDHGAAPYLVCLAAVNLGAVVLANIQAYEGRNLSGDLSESRYIGLIMMCLLQTWLTGGPVLFLVYDNPVSNYVVVSMICFLTCTAILALIFFPKIMHWKKWKAAQTGRIRTTPPQTGYKPGSMAMHGSRVSGLESNVPHSNSLPLGSSDGMIASIVESDVFEEEKDSEQNSDKGEDKPSNKKPELRSGRNDSWAACGQDSVVDKESTVETPHIEHALIQSTASSVDGNSEVEQNGSEADVMNAIVRRSRAEQGSPPSPQEPATLERPAMEEFRTV